MALNISHILSTSAPQLRPGQGSGTAILGDKLQREPGMKMGGQGRTQQEEVKKHTSGVQNKDDEEQQLQLHV